MEMNILLPYLFLRRLWIAGAYDLSNEQSKFMVPNTWFRIMRTGKK